MVLTEKSGSPVKAKSEVVGTLNNQFTRGSICSHAYLPHFNPEVAIFNCPTVSQT